MRRGARGCARSSAWIRSPSAKRSRASAERSRPENGARMDPGLGASRTSSSGRTGERARKSCARDDAGRSGPRGQGSTSPPGRIATGVMGSGAGPSSSKSSRCPGRTSLPGKGSTQPECSSLPGRQRPAIRRARAPSAFVAARFAPARFARGGRRAPGAPSMPEARQEERRSIQDAQPGDLPRRHESHPVRKSTSTSASERCGSAWASSPASEPRPSAPAIQSSGRSGARRVGPVPTQEEDRPGCPGVAGDSQEDSPGRGSS